MLTYLFILVGVLVISPFILRLAQAQKGADKSQLKSFIILIFSAQVFLGFFNWEKFVGGRSGLDLSIVYPNSFLGLFFIISAIQIVAMFISKSFSTLVVILNFLNTVLIFVAMGRLSSLLGFQAVSLASIGAVFLVLTGNVLGLAFINKDKNLLKKYRLI